MDMEYDKMVILVIYGHGLWLNLADSMFSRIFCHKWTGVHGFEDSSRWKWRISVKIGEIFLERHRLLG